MELILIIGKDHHLNFTLEYFLQGHRYRVVSTNDYKKGVMYSKSGSPEIILFGVYPEHRESIEALIEIKKEPISSDIPMICFFPKDDPAIISKVTRLGIVEYFILPPLQDPLLVKVKRILSENELYREKQALSRHTHILVEQPEKDIIIISFKSGLKKYVLPEIRSVFNAEFLNSVMEDHIALDIRDIPLMDADEILIIEKLLPLFKKKISLLAGKHLGLILAQSDLEDRVNLFMSMEEYKVFLETEKS